MTASVCPSEGGTTGTVAVCIATHDRPQGLAQLLARLNQQDLAPLQDEEVALVVVDNSASGCAARVVSEFRTSSRFALSYLTEPRRGEPFARNAAVAFARNARHYVFIDDDEDPDPKWLASLYAARCRSGAAIVCGVVLQQLACEPPAWYRPCYLETGPDRAGSVDLERLEVVAGTGNLLVGREVFDRLGPEPFPTQFALSGGTDREMLLRALFAGFTLVAAPDARVSEVIPPERLTLGYLLRRGYDGGHYDMRMRRSYGGRSWAPWALFVRGLSALGIWGVLALLSAGSPSRAIDCLHRATIHLGRVAAFLGRPPIQRYRVTDGR